VAKASKTRIVLTPVEKLASDLKITAGCRFIAAARLERRERSSNVLVSVYSALLICVSIATFALPLGSSVIRYASFGGIVASILLLVASMKNFAHRYGVEAEQMHRCALEINELRRLLKAQAPAIAEANLESYVDRYSVILQKWSINHSQEDFLDYKYKHKWEFDDIAEIPDKDLPDRRFREYYSVSAGGVSLLTILGLGFIIFIAYVLWTSIGFMQDSPNSAQDFQSAIDALTESTENLQSSTNALQNSTAVEAR
jgi:hypothetical protein